MKENEEEGERRNKRREDGKFEPLLLSWGVSLATSSNVPILDWNWVRQVS